MNYLFIYISVKILEILGYFVFIFLTNFFKIGGEDDMTAFDITPLQIPVADPAAIAAGHGVDTMKYAISAHPGTLPRAKMSSACKCLLLEIYFHDLNVKRDRIE